MSDFMKKYCRLSVKDQWLLINAWFVFLKWDLLISYIHFKKWRAATKNLEIKISKKNLTTTADFNRVKSIIQITEIAGRNHIKKMNCLRRCLTQKQLLSQRGYQSKIHIGVNLIAGKVSAHAWLSYNGEIINDTKNVTQRYNELKFANQQDALYSLK